MTGKLVLRYRAEIDGLRAVAVIPVILFHAGYETVSGGFVGVDVFFVISGFLITSIIVREIADGSFSIVNFYERRARRILPALFFVMFVCIPISYLTLPPDLLENFGQSLIATTLSANNILILLTSGYWEAEAELKPLLHTWSLAVEEQYYLVFPLLVMLLYNRGTKVLSVFLCVIFIASLILSWHLTQVNPRLAFLMIFTRAWELMLGSLAALYLVRRSHPVGVAYQEFLSAAGLCLILYAVFSFDYSNRMPGVWALLPTLGTFLIIFYANQGTIVHRLLSARPMVMIGLISYSAYLWHQPIFAFMRTESIWYDFNDYHFFIASIGSLLLGYVSWRYIEKPFRNRTRVSSRALSYSALGAACVLCAAGAFFHFTNGLPNRDPDYSEPTPVRSPCTAFIDGTCVYGDTSNIRIGLFGDSHAEALTPAFSALAGDTGVGIAYLGEIGCPPLLGVSVALGNPLECRQAAENQLQFAKTSQLDKVFLVARWSFYVSGDYSNKKDSFFLVDDIDNELSSETSSTVFARSLRQTVEAYITAGIEPVIVLQAPQHPYRVDYLYFQVKMREPEARVPTEILRERSIGMEEHLKLQSANRSIIQDVARATQVKVVNLDPVFCSEEPYCLMGTEDTAYYLDEDHVSKEGALLTVDRFVQFIGVH